MEPKFTTRAARILTLAQREAEKRGAEMLEPAHLLLAILRFDRSWKYPNNAVLILRKQGVALDALRESARPLLERTSTHSLTPPETHAFSERIRRVLGIAAEEMERVEAPYIGVEHLLLGLMQDSLIAPLLPGISLESVRETARTLHG